ncbi:acyltransferase [Sphingomonas sp. NBWT7]|uniref:acyltransferase family protein n=1 Tax=Sphingomonas sp. NBWT7 TaxID=2596913 RepID=UPI0016262C04|nr:acyltransferase [Sphingomonas sp. NBWT7]
MPAPRTRAQDGSTPGGSTPFFATLDGLRGIAALAVVTTHYKSMLAGWSFASAYLAVDLFFIVSGIVIEYAYGNRLAHGLQPGRFMAVRLLRLMPLYVIGQAIGVTVVLLALIAGQSNWTLGGLLPVALLGVLMIPNFLPAPRSDLFPLDVPCWSLFWELFINLAYAALLRGLSNRTLVIVFVVAQALLAFAATHLGSIDFGSEWYHAEIGALRVTAGFTLGVLIARLHRRRQPLRAWLPAPLVLALAAMVLALPVSYGWAKDLLATTLAFPLLCLAALAHQPRAIRVYALLGTLSYPLYIVHATLPIERVTMLLTGRDAAAFAPALGIVAMISACVLALLLARFYDQPLRRRLGSTLRRDRIAAL